MRKQDEMERSLTLKAIKISWIFTAVVLFIWGVVNYIKGMGQTFPMIVFILQVLVVLIMQQVYIMKTGDKNSKKNLNMMALSVITVIIFGGILLLFFK
ncbi:hypothetical protein JMF89_00915 [Clostridiaceae bacterium UIB06]|uniref:Uncharacterized protein n=1 Tax=Clostridium thailandense TaxID=2794346 RepID=A0A949THW3_9CLOT|nr:hypothetical protein [Clostridium thailandense]MBV7273114.1 hypothetical protein [Clostridium thailandense]MCH5135778.1 hypothetical protein [Clostridiaceae bacterium UIB06]